MSRTSIILIPCIAVALIASGVVVGMTIAPDHGRSAGRVRSDSMQERDRAVAEREAAWEQGRKVGRTEAEFFAQYDQLRADARAHASRRATCGRC